MLFIVSLFLTDASLFPLRLTVLFFYFHEYYSASHCLPFLTEIYAFFTKLSISVTYLHGGLTFSTLTFTAFTHLFTEFVLKMWYKNWYWRRYQLSHRSSALARLAERLELIRPSDELVTASESVSTFHNSAPPPVEEPRGGDGSGLQITLYQGGLWKHGARRHAIVIVGLYFGDTVLRSDNIYWHFCGSTFFSLQVDLEGQGLRWNRYYIRDPRGLIDHVWSSFHRSLVFVAGKVTSVVANFRTYEYEG